MLAIHTILHPTDFSERSEYAFRLACSLARDYNAHLVILHVAPPPTVVYGEGIIPPDPEILLREAKEQLQQLEIPDATIRAERRFAEGDPVAEIIRVAQEAQADLVVVGTHGRTGLGRLLMGSVAELVMRRAPCPVLTVRTPFPAAAPVPAMPVAETVQAGGI